MLTCRDHERTGVSACVCVCVLLLLLLLLLLLRARAVALCRDRRSRDGTLVGLTTKEDSSTGAGGVVV